MSVNGILFVDKAEGWTSHDVVAKTRRLLGTRKVGHAGTLDPMATGLLLLGAGPSTRLLTHLVGLDKTYVATVRLGQSTVTDDREGDLLDSSADSSVRAVTDEAIEREVHTLTGDIEQRPSAVSAIKVDGKRAYDRVRSGEEVALKARPVTIHAFNIAIPKRHELENGQLVIDIDATITCSSGTYIRALARDLGKALGIGGHLIALRRTAVGPFTFGDPQREDQDQPPQHLQHTSRLPRAVDALPDTARHVEGVPVTALTTEQLAAGTGRKLLKAPGDIARELFPVLHLDSEQTVDLGHGRTVQVDTADTPLAAALAPDGRLIGLVAVDGAKTRVITNFPVPAQAQSERVAASGTANEAEAHPRTQKETHA